MNNRGKYRALLTLFSILLFLCGAREAMALRFAFLSDTHVSVDGGSQAADLTAAVKDINAMTNIDFVLLTGDITELGWLAQFTTAKSILDGLKVPYYVLPGNHDTKWSESGATDFAKLWGYDRFVFDAGGFTFIGMHEGPILKTADGHWSPEDLRWLDDVLNRLPDSSRPLIFVTHYPMDSSIDNWYEVLERLKKYNTQVTTFGHGHANRAYTFEQLPGVMGRSNLRGGSGVGGYNLVDLSPTQMTFSERTTGQSTAAPWHTLALGPRNYGSDTNVYARPDYSVNTNYPSVKRLWQFSAGHLICASPELWKDTAIIGDASGTVYALRLDNGKVRWKFKTQGAVYGTANVYRDVAIVASTDGNVYALEAANGKEIWRANTSRPLVGCPRVADEKVFIGGSDGKFRAFELNTGKLLWTYAGLKGFVEARPLYHEGKVICGAWDGYLYCLDAATGKLVWRWMSGSGAFGYSPAACWPVAANGKIFVAAPDRYLSAINATSGQTVWRTNAWQVRESVGLSEDKSRVYARTMQDTIVAVSSSGNQAQQLWLLNAGFGYDINPAQLVEKDGTVFYGTKNGLLLALNGQTGVICWQHKLGPSVLHTVAPLSATRVVVSDFDGRVTLVEGQ